MPPTRQGEIDIIVRETSAVRDELSRALNRWGWQFEIGPAAHLNVILEELGEVAKEMNDAHNEGRAIRLDALQKELRQVAAMAIKTSCVLEMTVKPLEDPK